MTAPAPRNHPAEDAHPAPTPAPVAVPEGGLCDVRGPEMRYPDRPAATIVCHFPHGHGGDHESEDGARWGDWPPRPELAAPSSDTQDALRRLLDRGVGTDLTPTVSPTVDIGWWYDYLRRLDQRWRAEVARIAAILTLERPEPVVAPLPSDAVVAAREALANRPAVTYGVSSAVLEVIARDVLTAALPHLRLVPEDDEDAGDVGVLHPLHEACGWQIGPMPDIKTNRDFCREQVAKHREACTGKPEDDEDTVRVPRSAVERLRDGCERWRQGGDYLPGCVAEFLDIVDGAR